MSTDEVKQVSRTPEFSYSFSSKGRSVSRMHLDGQVSV
jgi:hypothetical protein